MLEIVENFYKAISADAFTKHGMNCNVLIYDELHAAKNSELWKKNKSNIYLISENDGFYNLYQLLKKEDINVYWNSKLPLEVISTQN